MTKTQQQQQQQQYPKYHCCTSIILLLKNAITVITTIMILQPSSSFSWISSSSSSSWIRCRSGGGGGGSGGGSYAFLATKTRNRYRQHHYHHRLFLSTTTTTTTKRSNHVWYGPTAPFSDYATHVQVSTKDIPTNVINAIANSMGEDKVRIEVLEEEDDDDDIVAESLTKTNPIIPTTIQKLTPYQLLHLGSIWFSRPEEEEDIELKSSKTNYTTTTDMLSSLPPPRRLTCHDALMELQPGDYLRIHHTPRRFTNVYQTTWNANKNNSTILQVITTEQQQQQQQQRQGENNNTNQSSGGFWIIDKPPLIPVHATVDNSIENVVYQLKHANNNNNNNVRLSSELQKQRSNSSSSIGGQQNYEEEEELPYVVTTQRLDINTSGLLVVATTKQFAAYFAQLLRNKTDDKITTTNSTAAAAAAAAATTTNKNENKTTKTKIEKGYRCLVCLQQQQPTTTTTNAQIQKGDVDETSSSSVSVYSEFQRLQELQGKTIRHYLERSDRAPKRFVETIPHNNITQKDDADDHNDDGSVWLECLLTITNVSPVLYPTTTTTTTTAAAVNNSNELAQVLWTGADMPSSAKAVCEVEIKLGTGRTHQIRGMLAKLGFPLVGDEQYGGAIPRSSSSTTTTTAAAAAAASTSDDYSQQKEQPQLLALQCCHVGFWDADYVPVWNRRKRKDVIQGIPSDRWISKTLESSWWTKHLLRNQKQGDNDNKSMTSLQDIEFWNQQQRQQQEDRNIEFSSNDEKKEGEKDSSNNDGRRLDLLPPTVQLSPGRNKYVLIKVNGGDGDDDLWFVRSASPKECGGAYHGNVAQDLIEWIIAAGYDDCVVTGGGRIDYDDKKTVANDGGGIGKAHVYGFSYGFGKGDHRRVARLIREQGIMATYDNSDKLY